MLLCITITVEHGEHTTMLHYSSHVKWKVYNTVLRPAMMCGAETWAVKKTQEKKLDVAEMRMLRWMSGVTKLDRIRNERNEGGRHIQESAGK